MVEYSAQQIDRIFYALSDSTRRKLLSQLSDKPRSVSELAQPHRRLTLAAVSKHLKVLEAAQIVKKTRAGRTLFCQVDPQPLRHAHQVLEQLGAFWRGRLDALEDFLAEQTKETKDESRNKGMSKGNRKPPHQR